MFLDTGEYAVWRLVYWRSSRLETRWKRCKNSLVDTFYISEEYCRVRLQNETEAGVEVSSRWWVKVTFYNTCDITKRRVQHERLHVTSLMQHSWQTHHPWLEYTFLTGALHTCVNITSNYNIARQPTLCVPMLIQKKYTHMTWMSYRDQNLKKGGVNTETKKKLRSVFFSVMV